MRVLFYFEKYSSQIFPNLVPIPNNAVHQYSDKYNDIFPKVNKPIIVIFQT